MNIRKSCHEDIIAIMGIIEDAKEYMKLNRIDQWQNGYPNAKSIEDDIIHGYSYVVEDDNTIIATFMAADIEEVTYNTIYEGQWLSPKDNKNYMIIHRIAVKNQYKGNGIFKDIINYLCVEGGMKDKTSIRIDTHNDNISMQIALKNTGFQSCGYILLLDGERRLAYEKLIS